MISIILLTSFVALVLAFIYSYSFVKPKGWPPGPPIIPIFGSYLFLIMANPKYLHKGAMYLSKLYKSDVISLFIGQVPAFVVQNPEGIKHVLNNQDFDDRPDLFVGRIRDPKLNRRGIFFQDGNVWKEQRRFVLRYLRDFGFGRRYQELELIINEEIRDMIDLMKNGPKYEHEKQLARKGQVLCPFVFMPFTTNSFLHVMCNERFARSENQILIELSQQTLSFQRHLDDYGKMLSIIPWIRHIFPTISSYKPLMKSNKTLHKFFKTIVDKNLQTYDENHERNFIDLYIKEMKEAEAKGSTDTTFDVDQFVMSLIDFAIPAITALGTQISFLMQWILLRPEVLKKIQIEIDDVVGQGRYPCLDDRINLNYTEAAIREVLRLETLVPSNIPHVAATDTELMGYHVPKGTVVVTNLHAYHTDKTIWNDPEDFQPERFLDINGKLSLKKDVSLPFGAGKRLCAGETFARNMLFLVVSAVCQNFNVVLPPNEKPPDMSQTLSGLIITPPDFWLTLEPR